MKKDQKRSQQQGDHERGKKDKQDRK
jgi:hypothetical protein